MTLVKCKECCAEISQKASICPKCGAPHKKPSGCLTPTVIAITFIGAFVLLANTSERPVAPQSRAPTKAELGAQATFAAKRAVPHRLKDPESAKFRDITAVEVGGTIVVCGQVNAKNAMGGYTGFKRFIWDRLVILEEDVTPSAFRDRWNSSCAAGQAIHTRPE